MPASFCFLISYYFLISYVFDYPKITLANSPRFCPKWKNTKHPSERSPTNASAFTIIFPVITSFFFAVFSFLYPSEVFLFYGYILRGEG